MKKGKSLKPKLKIERPEATEKIVLHLKVSDAAVLREYAELLSKPEEDVSIDMVASGLIDTLRRDRFYRASKRDNTNATPPV